MEWILYVTVGSISGFLAGLLGIGGGMVIVPAMLFALPLAGVGGPEIMKIAVATSMATIIPTAIASAQAHAAKGSISWEAFIRMAPGVVVGAMAGAMLAAQINPQIVALVFITFALQSATRMIMGARRTATSVAPLPGVIVLSVKGMCIGVLSSLLGVAGAALVIAALSRHVALTRAIGTASMTGLPLAVASVLGYALADHPSGCPQGCVGYVFLPAVGAVGVAAVLTAPWGARVAHALPVATLKRVFGCLLLLVAANLTHKTFPTLPTLSDGEALIAQVEAQAQRMIAEAIGPSTTTVVVTVAENVTAPVAQEAQEISAAETTAEPDEAKTTPAAETPPWLEHAAAKGNRLDIQQEYPGGMIIMR
jgi:uncharacterized protein